MATSSTPTVSTPRRPPVAGGPLFHGLEAAPAAYAAAPRVCRASRWRLALPPLPRLLRGTQSPARAYHSGDSAEIDWILARLAGENGERPVLPPGVPGRQRAAQMGRGDGPVPPVGRRPSRRSAPPRPRRLRPPPGRGFNPVYTPLPDHARSRLQRARPAIPVSSTQCACGASNLYQFDDAVTGPCPASPAPTTTGPAARAKPWLAHSRPPPWCSMPEKTTLPPRPATCRPWRGQPQCRPRTARRRRAAVGSSAALSGKPGLAAQRLLHFFDSATS